MVVGNFVRVLFARLVWLAHLTIFVYGAIGLFLPSPWHYFHLPLIIIVKLNWMIFDSCALTELENNLRNDNRDRMFTRDLMRRLGWKTLTREQTYSILSNIFWILAIISAARIAYTFM